MDKATTLSRLSACGVVAVIRAPSAEILPDVARALLEGGVVAIEVTMSTPDALRAIERVAALMGDRAIVGVGTVLDAPTARDAIRAGAQFVVSPVFVPSIVEATKSLGMVSIPGTYTPTEIITAWNAGADVVKLYPASHHGPAYVKELLVVMPFLKINPSGGIDAKNTGDYIRAGGVFVGAGTSLVSKAAMAGGEWASITASAKQFVEAVKGARAGK